MDLVYTISSLDSGQSFERSTDDVGMLYVPGGTFRMGSDRHYPEEAPVHRVTVGEFWMDRTPVTNRQFRKFVNATGYVTFAEIAPDAKDYPGALPHIQGRCAEGALHSPESTRRTGGCELRPLSAEYQ